MEGEKPRERYGQHRHSEIFGVSHVSSGVQRDFYRSEN